MIKSISFLKGVQNFADYTLLYTIFKQIPIQDCLNLSFELKVISFWLIVNKFQLNVKKQLKILELKTFGYYKG